MKPLRVILLVLLPSLAAADERTLLYGTWGDTRQCTGAMLQPGGTLRAAPFVIDAGWLRHGQTWCRLTWFPVQPHPGGLFVSTRALCGEDSARGFRLDFTLQDDALRLIWDEALVNGPLHRCGPG